MNKLFYTITYTALLLTHLTHPMDNPFNFNVDPVDISDRDVFAEPICRVDDPVDIAQEPLNQELLKCAEWHIPEDIEGLLEKGANPQVREYKTNETALHRLADFSQRYDKDPEKDVAECALESAEILYEAWPLAMRMPNLNKQAPLHVLLDIFDTDGKPYKKAAPLSVIKFFMDKTPEYIWFMEDAFYYSPVSYIFMHKNCHKILPLLQEKGINNFNFLCSSMRDETPLDAAISHHCNYKSVKALIQAGADPRFGTNNVIDFVPEGHEKCKKLLLDAMKDSSDTKTKRNLDSKPESKAKRNKK